MCVSYREGEGEKENGLKRSKPLSNNIINNNNGVTHTYSPQLGSERSSESNHKALFKRAGLSRAKEGPS